LSTGLNRADIQSPHYQLISRGFLPNPFGIGSFLEKADGEAGSFLEFTIFVPVS